MKIFMSMVFLMLFWGCGGSSEGPNVLLVILDTVSAGHVGYCGYHRNTTPVLDSLAAGGSAFTECRAQAPWTLPAGATILTGLYPRTHGVRRYGNGDVKGADPSMPTIATVLAENGYRTGGFVNNYLLGHEFGWHVGYDIFQSVHLGLQNAAPTVDSCLAWIDGLDENENFFAMVHFFDPHDPYDPPAPFDTLFGQGGPPHNWNTRETGEAPDPALRDHLISNYDGEIAHVDHQMGRLFQGIREMDLAENTIVIVVADHGEEFLERGQIWHGKSLHQEVLHVPLVLSGPGVPARSHDDVVGQVDIVPTIATLTGVHWPGPLEGECLLTGERDEPVFASNLNAGARWPVAGIENGMKATWYTTEERWLAYDLDEDPERESPVEPAPDLMESILMYWATPLAWEPFTVNRSTVDDILRDLGYI